MKTKAPLFVVPMEIVVSAANSEQARVKVCELIEQACYQHCTTFNVKSWAVDGQVKEVVG